MDSLEVQQVIANTPLAEQVNELYTNAFPREDKFAFDALCRFSANNEGAKFTAYLDDGQFCGFSFALHGGNYVYIVYLATAPALRSKGYGTRILNQFKAVNPGADLVLDIELPYETAYNATQRYRRRAFYERNGFWCTGDVFGVEDDPYLILTTGESWDREDFLKSAQESYGFLTRYYFGDITHHEEEVRRPKGE